MAEPLTILLAGLPIIAMIGLLVFRVKPLPAVIVAIGVLLALGFQFPINGGELADMSSRIVGVTINVVLILLGGLVLSVLSAESGAQRVMSGWFEQAAHNRDRAILLYGLGVTPFLEATIGWGVSLIVVVPLLLRAKVTPTRAVTVGLLGLVVCPWGSLAPGMLVTGELGGVDPRAYGAAAALFNLPVILVMAVLIAIVGLGRRMTIGIGIELAIAAGVLWGVLLLVNWLIGPPLAGILAALATIAVFLLFARLRGASPRMTGTEARSFAPFAVLLGSMLVMIALTSAVDLGAWAQVATSPGLWLIVSAASAPFFLRMQRADSLAALRRGVRSWIPVAITTLLYIAFGMLLSVTGMSATLADAAAANGTVFLLALPFIGSLAGYLTASITSVGTMLTLGVTHATAMIGADPVAALGVQTATAGGAVGASPSRVVLGISVAQEALAAERAEAAETPGAPDPGPLQKADFGKITLTMLGACLAFSSLLSLYLFVFPL